jgi:hypothetical protein
MGGKRRTRRRPEEDTKRTITDVTGLRLGQINKMIDSTFHPFFRKGPAPIILDGILHALAEADALKSLEKFLIYDGSPLLRECLKIYRAYKRAQG